MSVKPRITSLEISDKIRIDIMAKPWFVDALTYVLVFSWMAWTFATIQDQGASWDLIVPALVIGIVGILLVYGQRATFVQIGRVTIGFDSPDSAAVVPEDAKVGEDTDDEKEGETD